MTAPISKAARAYLSSIGRLGGSSGKGSAKARSSLQAQAAVRARWARWYAMTPEERAAMRRRWSEAAKKRARKGEV